MTPRDRKSDSQPEVASLAIELTMLPTATPEGQSLGVVRRWTVEGRTVLSLLGRGTNERREEDEVERAKSSIHGSQIMAGS